MHVLAQPAQNPRKAWQPVSQHEQMNTEMCTQWNIGTVRRNGVLTRSTRGKLRLLLTEMNQPNIAWLHLSEIPTVVKYRVKEGGVPGRGVEASGVSGVFREWH